MIAGCGQLGIDWRTLDLSDYLETLEAYNKAHETNKEPGGPTDIDRVRKFHKAQRGGKGGGGKAVGA